MVTAFDESTLTIIGAPGYRGDMDDSRVVADITLTLGYTEEEAHEDRDNASLIVAAPDLLKALKAIVDDIPVTSKEGRPDYGSTVTSDKIAAARKVIAKAEGRDI
jgi:hypothetical protein